MALRFSFSRRARRGAVAVAAMLVLTAAFGGTAATAAPAKNTSASTTAAPAPIRIGAVLALTGTLSFFGQEYKRGIELATTYINARGGIGGRPLEFEVLDGPNAGAVADAVRTFNSRGLKVYVGTGSSSFDNAASAVSDPLGMIGWVTGVDKTLTEIRKFMFQPQQTTDWFTQPAKAALAAIPKRLGKKSRDMKVALICSNDAYGQSNCASQKQYVRGYLNANLVLEQYYDRAATDFTGIIQRLQSAQPDAIAGTGYTDDVVLLWQQARQLGYQPKYVVSSGGAATTNFSQALGSWANGFMTYSYLLPSKGNSASMLFARNYQRRYGEPVPSGHALMTYAMIWKLADVLRLSKGSTDPTRFAAAANQLVKPQNFYPDGCGFKLYKNRNSRCATVGMQWQNGKLVAIWPKRLATHKMIGPMPIR